MSSETKHYCDHCKKEEDRNNLYTVQIKLNPYSNYSNTYARFESVSSYDEYCIECIEKLGFVKKTIKEGQAVVEPTTRDKLYDIVAQIVSECREDL